MQNVRNGGISWIFVWGAGLINMNACQALIKKAAKFGNNVPLLANPSITVSPGIKASSAYALQRTTLKTIRGLDFSLLDSSEC